MIINNNFNTIEKEDLNTMNKQMNNLELIFNKVVENKASNNKLIKKIKNDDILKGDILKNLCSDIEEKIFLESTRGFNIKDNVFKIRFDKLKQKLSEYKIPIFYSIGYIYRDFNNPKSFLEKDINIYWLDFCKKDGIITTNYLKPQSRMLQACLKNLSNNNKFKKKINGENIRAFKKSVQINNSQQIIDLIFYVKYKINNTNL